MRERDLKALEFDKVVVIVTGFAVSVSHPRCECTRRKTISLAQRGGIIHERALIDRQFAGLAQV